MGSSSSQNPHLYDQEHTHTIATDQPTIPAPFPHLQTGDYAGPPSVQQHGYGNNHAASSPSSTAHDTPLPPPPPPINAIIPSGYAIHAASEQYLSPAPPLAPPIQTHLHSLISPQTQQTPATNKPNFPVSPPQNPQPIPGVDPNPALNENATQAYHTQNTSLFAGLDDLTTHLKQIPGSGNTSAGPGPSPGDKSVPIVLLPGFLGWTSPLLNFYNYFGGLVNLAQDLADRGWPVIVPMIGAVSSNWERACELYAQLSRGSFDGKTYDVIVDYGVPPPDSGIVYANDPPPKRRQAACFNLDPSWRWGPRSPVHFVAHSQGGNTVRYLIHLLESGRSTGNNSYFREEKLGWVKSLVTLATPFNGTSIIDVLEQMGDVEDVLMDNAIAASSWAKPESRVFDFNLDHRGLRPPEDGTPEASDFLIYLEKVKGPDGALTKWRKSRLNGLYDNSILGVAGDLNKIIGLPSKDVYYFTLSFAATEHMPVLGILNEDILNLVKLSENLDRFTGLFSRFVFWGSEPSQPAEAITDVTNISTSTSATATTHVTSTPKPESSSWLSHIPSKRARKLAGMLRSSSPSSSRSSSVPPRSSRPPITNDPPRVSDSQENRALLAHTTFTAFFSSLQDLAKWTITRINTRLPGSVPKLPIPGTTIPRSDMFPPFILTAYGMGAYGLSATQRSTIAAYGGPTKDSEWHEHDGVVNTVSMRGPWGCGNRIVRVEEVIGKWSATVGFQGVAQRREDIRGVWVDLGKCTYMDHADCIGTGVNPITIIEVVDLYRRISELLELL